MIRIDCRGLSTDAVAASTQIGDAADCLVKHGYAILDHILPEQKVHDLCRAFNQYYARYLHDHEAEESLQVSKRRFMVPIGLGGAFADPLVYANPYVLALVRAVLDKDAILEAFGAIVSLSGSEAQRLHSDAPPLFNSEISALLPAHALTFGLPLVEMNDVHGTTALVPGSHRWQHPNDEAPAELPIIPVGSGLLWDFRLYHRGTPNRSECDRPMIYATYARPWYRDAVNFRKPTQHRLMFEPDFLKCVPVDARPLFPQLQSRSEAADTNRNQT